jgi:hypothetical protein
MASWKAINKKFIASFVLLYLGATVLGLGVAYKGGIFTNGSTGSTSSPYALTLVETMNANSSSPAQAKFFVLGNNGLESSANITLPAHRLIQLTIMSYDTPTPNSTDQQGVAMGTVGNTVYFINGTIASMGSMAWGMNVSSIPGSSLAHTFTLLSATGVPFVNIPFVGGSTVIAYFYLENKGTFTWICLTPCGTGPKGKQGAMSAPGWMEGQLTVS